MSVDPWFGDYNELIPGLGIIMSVDPLFGDYNEC